MIAFAPVHATAAKAPPVGRRPANFSPGEALLKAAPSNVRVLLGNSPFPSFAGEDLEVNGQRLAGREQFSVRCGQNAEGPYVDFGAGRSAEQLSVYAPGGFLRVDGKLYRTRITVIPHGNLCAVINTVNLEKYLAGVLNKEMAPNWPLEALKAQAVAARTYALHQVMLNPHPDYDLESSVMDQVYDGASSETPRSTQAVEATRGLVLTFANHPLKAYFHANCGGTTDVPVAVWGSDSEAFRPVICPYHHRKRDQQHWSIHVTRLQLDAALHKVAGLLPTGFVRVAHLEAGAPDQSQRLTDVMVSDAAGNNLVLSANELRKAVGVMKMKSTAFHVEEEPGGFHIEGDGFGHGVGMCQVGARAMAEEGKVFRQILSFYYPLARLKKM